MRRHRGIWGPTGQPVSRPGHRNGKKNHSKICVWLGRTCDKSARTNWQQNFPGSGRRHHRARRHGGYLRGADEAERDCRGHCCSGCIPDIVGQGFRGEPRRRQFRALEEVDRVPEGLHGVQVGCGVIGLESCDSAVGLRSTNDIVQHWFRESPCSVVS